MKKLKFFAVLSGVIFSGYAIAGKDNLRKPSSANSTGYACEAVKLSQNGEMKSLGTKDIEIEEVKAAPVDVYSVDGEPVYAQIPQGSVTFRMSFSRKNGDTFSASTLIGNPLQIEISRKAIAVFCNPK